jgi:nitroreductase
VHLLRTWNAGDGFKKLSREAIQASGAVCLVSVPRSTPSDLLRGGRAAERMWLSATSLGIAVHPISAPIFLAHHVRFGGGAGFDREETEAILQALAGIRRVFSTGPREPLFMARLALAEPPTVRSLRRPLTEILHIHQPVAA